MREEAEKRQLESERRMREEAEKRQLESENRAHKDTIGLIKWMTGMQFLAVGATLAGVAALVQLLG